MDDLISRKHFDERLRTAGGIVWDELSEDYKGAVCAILEMLKTEPSVTAERKPAWTPVKTRPLTDEERDGLLINAECAFDCPMPEDGQEVIVTTDLGGVGIDTFCRDVEGCYFENYDDDVIAWMPLPEPWKEAGE